MVRRSTTHDHLRRPSCHRVCPLPKSDDAPDFI
ncbi:unnamed protein product [Ectocarpus sp. CCAP 1310/34]|nr:unnamed protein product [Ectocarpus sp. CCAP 1310/34]